jgi:hypothetical protein
MALTSSQICAIARNRSKAVNYTTQSGLYLNLALQEICLTGDYEIAKGAFNSTFAVGTTPIGNLNVQLASGPFTLPPDYLRAKRGDIIYYPTPAFPLFLIPIDLEEFDIQVQQAGFQNFPVFWATDTSRRADVVTTSGTTISGNGVISNVGNLLGITVGQGVYGDAIAPSTVTLVTAVNSGAGTVTVSPAANVIATYADPARSSLTFAVCPSAYVWPPVGGAYPYFLRYFRKMSDIWKPESSQQIPWFEYQDFLMNEVTGRLMFDVGDDRWKELVDGHLPERLRKFLQMVDDNANRPRRVHLDRRRFGKQWASLPASKTLGY